MTRSEALLPQIAGDWSILPPHLDQLTDQAQELNVDLADQADVEFSGLDVREAGSVRVLPVHGPMTKHASLLTALAGGTPTRRVRAQLRDAVADDDVGAVVLHVDSPGGMVAGTDDLAQDVARAAEEMPVFAFVEDLGASAAYWVASQADKVVANPTAKVGSIGVYSHVFDRSDQFEEKGIDSIVIKTGEHKGDFAEGTEIEDEQIKEKARVLEDLHEQFVAAVADGRNLSTEDVEELADGRVHIAEDAKDLGLIDAVGTFDSLVRDAAQEAGEGTIRSLWNAKTTSEPLTLPLMSGLQVDGDGHVTDTQQADARQTSQVKVPNNPEGGSGEGVEGEWDASTHASVSALADFVGTDAEEWGEFTEEEKVQAGQVHADRADSFTEDADADLNLPHHFTQGENSGAASLNGARNALSRLPQTEGLHSEESAIESHLQNHIPSDDESKLWSRYIQDEVELDEVLEHAGVTREELGLPPDFGEPQSSSTNEDDDDDKPDEGMGRMSLDEEEKEELLGAIGGKIDESVDEAVSEAVEEHVEPLREDVEAIKERDRERQQSKLAQKRQEALRLGAKERVVEALGDDEEALDELIADRRQSQGSAPLTRPEAGSDDEEPPSPQERMQERKNYFQSREDKRKDWLNDIDEGTDETSDKTPDAVQVVS